MRRKQRNDRCRRDRCPSSEASVTSRLPGIGARSNGRFRWHPRRPRSQRGVTPILALCSFERPSVSRSSHSAWSRLSEPLHPSPWQANARFPIIKRCTNPPSFRPCRSTRRAGLMSRHAQLRTFTRGKMGKDLGET